MKYRTLGQGLKVSAIGIGCMPMIRNGNINYGQANDDEFLFIIACNPKFTGSGMKLAPHAEIGDGKIDVVVVRRATRWQMLKLFTKVFDGSHIFLDYVEYHQVRSFAIEFDGPDLLDLDGEMKGHAPLSAEVLPSALRIFG